MRSRVTYIRQCWAYKTDLALTTKAGAKCPIFLVMVDSWGADRFKYDRLFSVLV
jgi:hypothetical protein